MVAGHRLDGGVYVGTHLPGLDGGAPDACLINPELRVARGMPDFAGRLMGYWPSYSQIKEVCRLAYLTWHDHGRATPRAYIGFPFLYFYGLERRLLERADHKDRGEVVAEIRRLMEVYAHEPSFVGYARAILDAVALTDTLIAGRQASLAPAELADRIERLAGTMLSPQPAALAIGTLAALGREITPELWLRHLLLRNKTQRLRAAFDAVFPALLDLARDLDPTFFARPVLDATIPTPRLALYDGASAHHRNVLLPGFETLKPHPLGDKQSSWKRGAKITADVIARAKDYLDAVWQKAPADDADIIAMIKRPRPPFQAAGLVDSLIRSADGAPHDLQPILDALGQAGLSAKSSGKLMSELARYELDFAPDPMLGECKALKGDGTIALFARPDTATRPLRARPAYQLATRLLRLGIHVVGAGHSQMVAAAAGRIVPDLSPSERRRLAPLARWIATQPKETRSGAKQLSAQAEPRATELRFAAGVAVLADDHAPATLKRLEALYKAGGKDSKSLYEDMHRMAMARGGETHAKRGGAALIENIQADTRKAAELLATVFVDAHSGPESNAAQPPDAEQPGVCAAANDSAVAADRGEARFPGLEPARARLLTELLARHSWPLEEAEAMARKIGLGLAGAIEAINDHFFDEFDGPVIEEGAEIQLDPALTAAFGDLSAAA